MQTLKAGNVIESSTLFTRLETFLLDFNDEATATVLFLPRVTDSIGQQRNFNEYQVISSLNSFISDLSTEQRGRILRQTTTLIPPLSISLVVK